MSTESPVPSGSAEDGVTAAVASEEDRTTESQPRLTGLPLLAVALVVVVVVQAAFVVSYVGALHSPKPHDLAIGVVGASPLPIAVSKQYSLRTVPYASEQAAREAIDNRNVNAAFIASSKGSTLIVVPAAGPVMASSLGTAFGAAAAALKQPIAVVQVHPLPEGDAGGGVSFLVVMALVVGGYLSATIALVWGGTATRHRRLLALACVAVVGALLTDTIAGPVLGALPSSKFLVLWGLFVLVMAAVAFSAAALQTLLGAAGTLVVVVLFVIFGAPAAGGTVPSAFLPELWRVVGPYLPAGAGTTAVRNTIYFDGNAIGQSLLVLTAYLVAGAIVVIAIRRRQAPTPASTAEAEAAAAIGTAIV